MVELEGLEMALPRVFLPRPALNLPRVPTMPVPPNYPIPPAIPVPPGDVSVPSIPRVPSVPSEPILRSGEVDWELAPPKHPDDLGKDWEETTHPNNKSGGRDFKNKETGEKLRWDPQSINKNGRHIPPHWHRKNPNFDGNKGGKGKYLDNKGNPVDRYSQESHIFPSSIILIQEVYIKSKKVYGPQNVSKSDWKQYKKSLNIYNRQLKRYNRKVKNYNEKLGPTA